MLKCASLYTCELDDAGLASWEINSQLNEKISLLEHTVGVVMCHPEFIAAGILQYICENLPFDLVGVTSAAQAVNDKEGEAILTIFVMTADDVWFRAGSTESVWDDLLAPTKSLYDRISAGEAGPPKLALIFPPFLIEKYAGDAYVKVWDKILPGTPCFGPLATDDTVSFQESETIFNGVSTKDAMSCILCYGNIRPRFLVGILPKNNAVSLQGKVTKSSDNLVYEIDGMNARTFFESTNVPDSMLTIPFLIDLRNRDDYDGVPVVRGRASFTEEGAAVFYGDVDEGSTFSLLRFTFGDILSSSLSVMERMNGLAHVNGALLFPCVVRRIALLSSDKAVVALKTVRKTIRPDIPYMLGYAGGEICPTSVRDGIPTNRFHNYSMIILVI